MVLSSYHNKPFLYFFNNDTPLVTVTPTTHIMKQCVLQHGKIMRLILVNEESHTVLLKSLSKSHYGTFWSCWVSVPTEARLEFAGY